MKKRRKRNPSRVRSSPIWNPLRESIHCLTWQKRLHLMLARASTTPFPQPWPTSSRRPRLHHHPRSHYPGQAEHLQQVESQNLPEKKLPWRPRPSPCRPFPNKRTEATKLCPQELLHHHLQASPRPRHLQHLRLHRLRLKRSRYEESLSPQCHNLPRDSSNLTVQFPRPGGIGVQQLPEAWGMVHFIQMGKLVPDNVVLQLREDQDKPPV